MIAFDHIDTAHMVAAAKCDPKAAIGRFLDRRPMGKEMARRLAKALNTSYQVFL